MKTINVCLLFVGIFLVGIISGFLFGTRYESRSLHNLHLTPREVNMAFIAAQEANWLAGLRLNETSNVIISLENSLNIAAGTLAAWDNTALPNDKVRKERDGWLTAVKVYREYYPANSEDASSINALLSNVSNKSPNSDYFDFVYRLAELQSTNHSITNLP